MWKVEPDLYREVKWFMSIYFGSMKGCYPNASLEWMFVFNLLLVGGGDLGFWWKWSWKACCLSLVQSWTALQRGCSSFHFLCWALSLYLSKPFQKPRAWARVVAEADCLSLAVAQELRMVYISWNGWERPKGEILFFNTWTWEITISVSINKDLLEHSHIDPILYLLTAFAPQWQSWVMWRDHYGKVC